MRLQTQISLTPDGAITRVHVIAQDLDQVVSAGVIYELSYDSGVAPPASEAAVPAYLEDIARQLRARIAVDRKHPDLIERGQAQRLLS